jgi:hypothetical protein
MKNLIYLSVLLSVWSLKLNAQDIDFPLLQSEIEKYESRVHIQRLPNVYVTHPDAYKIRTQQPVLEKSRRIGKLSDALEGLKFLCSLSNMETHADLIAGLPL